jgi:hypothetical protein
VGDFWAISLSDGRFGCAIVTDLKASGSGSRSNFVAGLVDWVGTLPPIAADASGGHVFAQGMTRIEAITHTRSQVLGSVRLPWGFKVAPNYRDFRVGTVHHVWGWKVLPGLIEQHLAGQ